MHPALEGTRQVRVLGEESVVTRESDSIVARGPEREWTLQIAGAAIADATDGTACIVI